MIRMATNHTLLCIHQDPGQLSLLKEHGYNLVSATNAPAMACGSSGRGRWMGL